MKINLIAVGKKMPSWVNSGFSEYAKRLPVACTLNLIEIDAVKRRKGINAQTIVLEEGKRILAALPKQSRVIALDVRGATWSTEALATQLKHWQEGGSDVSLLVGGPEGLAADCLTKAQAKWSLSALTFPHPLVRVIIAEQIYRAWSILNHHPYHRA